MRLAKGMPPPPALPIAGVNYCLVISMIHLRFWVILTRCRTVGSLHIAIVTVVIGCTYTVVGVVVCSNDQII